MKIFILAFVCFFISSAFAQSILNESAFTQRYANAAITKTEVVSADIRGRLEIEMTYSDGGTSTAYLDNAYMNYLSEPAELDVIIELYISALTKNSSDAKANMEKAHIVPVIKMDVVKAIEKVGSSSGRTAKPVVIADCGQLC